MISFIYFNLIYIDSHEKSLEKIPIAVRSITTIFDMAEQILDIERQSLVLLLFEDSTRIDDKEYLESLNEDTDLLICTEEQHEKLVLNYFLLKKVFTALN